MWFVIGATGELGKHVANELKTRQIEFIGTWSGHEKSTGHDGMVVLDLTSPNFKQEFTGLMEMYKPDVVVHAAICKHDASQPKELVQDVVVSRTLEIGESCAIVGARLLMMSTDVIFDGKLGKPYDESAIPTPTLWYGECKVEMEKGLLAMAPKLKVCILRTSLIFTLEPDLKQLMGKNEKRSKAVHFCVSRSVESFKKGEIPKFFTDERRNGTCGDDLASAMVDMALLSDDAFEQDICGIINLVAPTSMSRLELAQICMEFYSDQLETWAMEEGIELGELGGCLSAEIFNGTRPLDCTLDTAKYLTLQAKYGLHPLRSVLECFRTAKQN